MKCIGLFLIIIALSKSVAVYGEEAINPHHEKIIADASEVVQKVFEASNNMKYLEGLEYYAADSNSYYVSDGKMHTLSELKNVYLNAGQFVESLHNDILSINAKVISDTVISFTLPVNLRLKLIDTPEYNGQIIWTAILEKRGDEWIVIQSHESWLNCAEVAKALNPSS